MHRNTKRLAGKQHTEGRDCELSEDGDKSDDHNRQGILHNHGGIDHHTDGEKEDRPEEVFDPGGQVLHALRVNGARQKRTGQERAEGRGEAEMLCQKDHAEADAERDDQQGFIVHEILGLLQKSRQNIDPENQPQRKIEHQFAQLQRKSDAGDVLAHGDRRENDHHENAGDVLDDQRPEDQLRKRFLAYIQLIKGLDDDGGGAHGEHAAEENTVHHRPAHCLADKIAENQHAEHFGQSRNNGGPADTGKLVKVKLQAEAEHENDDTDLTPGLDGDRIHNREEVGHIRADQKTGQDISQYQRLLYTPEEDGDHPRGQQHHRKIRYQFRHDLPPSRFC